MGLGSVEKSMGPFNRGIPRTEIYTDTTCMGCKRARAAATGKPEGLHVMSCGFLQHIVVIVVPALREPVHRWS